MASAGERRPFSPVLMSCITPLLVASLVVKPTPYRALFAIPVLGISYYLLYYTTTGDAVMDLAIGDPITALAATAIDFIILSEPQTQLFKRDQLVPSASFSSLWEKIKWALDLLSSHRGIGWTHEPTSRLPAAPFSNEKASRWQFIGYQLLIVVTCFLMWDVCALYTRVNPVFTIAGPPLSSEPLLWRCINLWAWAIPAAAALTISHSLASIAFVSLGIWSDISQWRPFFGNLGDAYTVGRLWSRTWHQSMRRVVTAPGYKLISFFSIPRGSAASSLILLYTSFFVSAWIHHPGDYMMLGRYGGALKFFLAQPFIITVETQLIAFAKRLGLREGKIWRLLGYLWVQIWFTHLVPVWIQPQIDVGLMENGMGFSVILGVWEGNWTPGNQNATVLGPA